MGGVSSMPTSVRTKGRSQTIRRIVAGQMTGSGWLASLSGAGDEKRLGLSDEEENAPVSFMQTLSDDFMTPGAWRSSYRFLGGGSFGRAARRNRAFVIAEDHDRKQIRVERRKDDRNTTIWHKRYSPFWGHLRFRPAAVLCCRQD